MRKWCSSGTLNGSYTVPIFGFSLCHCLEKSICGQFCWCRPMRIMSGKYGAETGQFWDSASPPLPFVGNTPAVHIRRGNRNGTISFSTTLRTRRPNPRWVKKFLFSIAFAPNLTPVNAPIHLVLGGLPPGDKEAGTWCWLQISILYRG